MTPLQLVRDECANYQPDGSCLGMMINRDLSITRGHALPRCLVADGKRCPYFEECVAPMADMATDPRRAATLQEAVAEYRLATNQKAPALHPCPDCGASKQPRKRYCPRCALKRRVTTYRQRDAAKRIRNLTVKPKNAPESPIISGANWGDTQNAIEDSHLLKISP